MARYDIGGDGCVERPLVIFDKNSASATGTMSDKVMTVGTPTALTTNSFVNPGYTFAGWATSSTGPVVYTNGANYTMTTAANITLYAKWNIVSYAVTFNSNGGSVVSQITANYDTTITTPADPTKAGYTFGGWYKESILTNAWNFTTDKVTAATTLFAKWTLNSASECTGTRPANSTVKQDIGTSATSFPWRYYNNPNYDPCTFECNSGTTYNVSNNTCALNAASTHTVTFNSNSGTLIPPRANISHNTTITAPANPTRS